MNYATLSCDCDIGWVEFWQRKKRQYFCSDQENWSDDEKLMSEVNDHFDCENPYIDDDLRSARCSNKNGEPLLEVLKSELECGWSSSKRAEVNIFVLVIFAIAFPTLLI